MGRFQEDSAGTERWYTALGTSQVQQGPLENDISTTPFRQSTCPGKKKAESESGVLRLSNSQVVHQSSGRAVSQGTRQGFGSVMLGPGALQAAGFHDPIAFFHGAQNIGTRVLLVEKLLYIYKLTF